MKKIIISLIIVISVSTIVSSQNRQCATPDVTYEEYKSFVPLDNKELQNFIEETVLKSLKEVEDGILFRIPIKFWIYVDDNGENWGNPLAEIPDELNFQLILDSLNILFAQNNIPARFYIACSPTFITNSNMDNPETWRRMYWGRIHHLDHALNLHLVSTMPNASGWALQRSVETGVWVTWNAESSTPAHEVGHHFGLLHPHQWTESGIDHCLSEPVSRGFVEHESCVNLDVHCEYTGDFICDTPADPRRLER